MSDDTAFDLLMAALVLGFLLFMGFLVWTDGQTKQECIRAGMAWHNGDCTPREAT